MPTAVDNEEITALYLFLADDHAERNKNLRCEVEDDKGNVHFAKHVQWKFQFNEKAVLGTLIMSYVHHGDPISLTKIRFYYRERQFMEQTPPPTRLLDGQQGNCSRNLMLGVAK